MTVQIERRKNTIRIYRIHCLGALQLFFYFYTEKMEKKSNLLTSNDIFVCYLIIFIYSFTYSHAYSFT